MSRTNPKELIEKLAPELREKKSIGELAESTGANSRTIKRYLDALSHFPCVRFEKRGRRKVAWIDKEVEMLELDEEELRTIHAALRRHRYELGNLLRKNIEEINEDKVVDKRSKIERVRERIMDALKTVLNQND